MLVMFFFYRMPRGALAGSEWMRGNAFFVRAWFITRSDVAEGVSLIGKPQPPTQSERQQPFLQNSIQLEQMAFTHAPIRRARAQCRVTRTPVHYTKLYNWRLLFQLHNTGNECKFRFPFNNLSQRPTAQCRACIVYRLRIDKNSASTWSTQNANMCLFEHGSCQSRRPEQNTCLASL